VSVIMPVFNSAAFLDEAIQSILNQTFTRFELIIVENGSADQSLVIAQRYAGLDARVRVQHLDEPGTALALNAGLATARAPWIARMDADDVALPHRLERQLAFLARHTEVAALGTYGWIIGRTGRVVGCSRLGPTSLEAAARLRAGHQLPYLLASSVLFSRASACAVGGHRQDYCPAEDIDFWSRLADNHLLLTLPEPLICYRIHTQAASTRHLKEQLQLVRRAKANMIRRRQGLAELDKQAFQNFERSQPFWRRADYQYAVVSQYCYRYGGALLAAGEPRGLIWLGLAALLSPASMARRLKDQQVLPSMLRPWPSMLRPWT
jgi:glycosyltransferase involved in cell wall biosynthesis